MTTLESPPSSHPRSFLRHALRRFFERRGVRAWVGADVTIVQGHVALQADVAVALGADDRPRTAWVRDVEGRSIDVAFRVVAGRSRLGAITSAARHVELGAQEAFAFDPSHATLWGFHRRAQFVDAMTIGAEGEVRSWVLGAELRPLPRRLRLLPLVVEPSLTRERLAEAVRRATPLAGTTAAPS